MLDCFLAFKLINIINKMNQGNDLWLAKVQMFFEVYSISLLKFYFTIFCLSKFSHQTFLCQYLKIKKNFPNKIVFKVIIKAKKINFLGL